MLWKNLQNKISRNGKENINGSYKRTVFLVALFILLFLATRLSGLGRDEINPDAVNWHYRTEQFLVGLRHAQFEKTYQHYHPGVTLMWIAGLPIGVIKQFTVGNDVYTVDNFLLFHTWVKITIVFVQLFLTLFLLRLLTLEFDFLKAFFIILIFTFEPFFLGNSRLFHMDILLALFLVIALLLSYQNLCNLHRSHKVSWLKGVAAGIFFALAFLTKSIAIGGISFSLGFALIYLLVENGKRERKIILRYLLSLAVPFLLAVFLLFPALWVAPAQTLADIFKEALRIGVRKGHGQIFLAEYTRDPGAFFYPAVLLLRFSLATLVGLLSYVLFTFFPKSFFQNRLSELKRIFKGQPSLVVYLAVFYLGYFLVMTLASKKLDRYMLPLYPFFATLAVIGYHNLLLWLKKGFFRRLLFVFPALFLFLPAISLYPYYYTYTNPLFGSPEKANKVIAQKPFGVGIPALRDFIFANYGQFPTLGFIDKKPMGAIYMNSKIFGIRVDGTNKYDLIVLGINEEMPEKILRSGANFIHDKSFFINGLEYWRVYAKK